MNQQKKRKIDTASLHIHTDINHVSKSSTESPVTASVKDLTPLSAKWFPNDHVFNLTAFAKSQTKKYRKNKNYVAEYTGSKRFKRILDACIQLRNVDRSCLVFTKKNKRFASRLNTYTSEPAIAFDFANYVNVDSYLQLTDWFLQKSMQSDMIRKLLDPIALPLNLLSSSNEETDEPFMCSINELVNE